MAGKGVRLLDGGGDEMEGVLSIDDDVLLASLIVIGDSGSLASRCTLDMVVSKVSGALTTT